MKKIITSYRIPSFLKNTRGNTLAIFAGFLFVAMGFGGLSLDNARRYFVQERIQAGLDTAGLAAARFYNDDARRDATIDQFFAANMQNGYLGTKMQDSSGAIPHVNLTQNASSMELHAAGSVPTVLMQAFGQDDMYAAANTTIEPTLSGMEVAFVFDVSTSMNSHLTTLRDATLVFVDHFYGTNTSVPGMRVSVVTYGSTVNIGRNHVRWLRGGQDAIDEAKYEFSADDFVSEADLQKLYDDGVVASPLPVGFADVPEDNCTYNAPIADYWHGPSDDNIPEMVPAQWDGYACVLGIRKDMTYTYGEQTQCEAKGENGHPIGVWEGGACIVGDYWKGCIIGRMPTLYKTHSDLEFEFATRYGWPLGIKPKSTSGYPNEDAMVEVEFQDDANLDLVLSDTPPTTGLPETFFEPFVWEPQGGVGHNNYDPRVPTDDYGDYQNNPNFPVGLGTFHKDAFDPSKGAYALESAFENWNDYLGGANAVNGGNTLAQPIDERLFVGGVANSSAPYIDHLYDNKNNNGTTARGPNLGCPSPMKALLSERSDIEAALDDIYSPGNTASLTNVGLAWGWRALSPKWRNVWDTSDGNFPKAYDADRNRKVLILLSEGPSRMSSKRWTYYKRTWDFATLGVSDHFEPDDGLDYLPHSIMFQALDLCERIKATGIEMFVITKQLGNSDLAGPGGSVTSLAPYDEPAFKEMMKGCASSEDNFYYLSSFNSLETIFKEIAERISAVRIAK